MCQNGVRAKQTEAVYDYWILSTFFQKDNMNLKHWMYFFESAFEDLSFHSFLKASDWDFEEKNGCNKHRICLKAISLNLLLP